MAEWIYFLHAPREILAAMMTTGRSRAVVGRVISHDLTDV